MCDHHQPRAGQCRTAEWWQLSTTDGAGGPTLLSIYWLCKYCCSPVPCQFYMVYNFSYKNSFNLIHVFRRNHYTLHKCSWFDILWNPVNSNYGRNFGQPQHRQCLFKVIKDGGDCAGKWIDILSYYHMLCIDFRGESKHTRIFLASPILHIFLLFIEFLVNQIKSINRSHMCNLKCSAVSSQLR